MIEHQVVHNLSDLLIQLSLLAIYLLSAFFVIQRYRKDVNDPSHFRSWSVILLCALFAYLGARIFHNIFEAGNPPFHDLLNGSGRVFYGALGGGALVVFLASLLVDRKWHRGYWELALMIASLGYGFLRLGCFVAGCCWGTLTEVPWAVVYTNSEVMGHLGVPVHPVQLYDSVLGFAVFAVLVILKEQGRPKILPFFVLLSIGRFFTEFYRGDEQRGVQVVGFMSTGQWMSLVVLLTALTIALAWRLRLVNSGQK